MIFIKGIKVFILLGSLICINLAARNIIVVRHGEADHNIQRAFNSRLTTQPAHLTTNGKTQVLKTAQNMLEYYQKSKNPICGVFISPLERTKETAEIIKSTLKIDETKIKITFDDRLIEVQMGDLEGKLHKDCTEFVPENDSWNISQALRYNGETEEKVSLRVRSLIDMVMKSNCEGDFIFITHGTPAKAAISLLEPGLTNFKLKTAEFKIIDVSKNSNL